MNEPKKKKPETNGESTWMERIRGPESRKLDRVMSYTTDEDENLKP